MDGCFLWVQFQPPPNHYHHQLKLNQEWHTILNLLHFHWDFHNFHREYRVIFVHQLLKEFDFRDQYYCVVELDFVDVHESRQKLSKLVLALDLFWT